ncbi:hypothetical protein EDC96DRAFT_497384 [Choanephora cucurbitarum]|uniref:ATPase inhibitor, mitochondrial n=1 Tax=Choanephora cucurbitarum TaxID=101091 RepID=A0A1C7NLB9_9FUNG|nr:hypothetical protein EDC96DRAFT_497384 [Choanephora cucurbitarum]OBZ89798.1 hypothetical protein A0J61_02151 [Choanephora cucurbitarum]
MFSQLSTRVSGRTNILSRRALHMTSIARSEGATASSKGFSEREAAAENRWARAHDAEKIKILREHLAAQEQSTADIKKKLAELEKK